MSTFGITSQSFTAAAAGGTRVSGLIPTVIDKTPQGERAYDIYSRLLEDRIVFLGSGINDAVANTVIAQLLFLEKKDAKKDITLYVNSPGGSVSATLAMVDTMHAIAPDVSTVCVGMAASGGGAGTGQRRRGQAAGAAACRGDDSPAAGRRRGAGNGY